MAALDLLPYLAAGLLLVAGASKVRHPDTMADVLAVIGVTSPHAPFILGLIEIVVGAAAMVFGGFVLWGLVTALYLAFAALLALLTRNDAEVSCGCFGQRSTPVGRRQVLADLGTAGLAAIGVVISTPGLFGADRSPAITALLIVGIAVGSRHFVVPTPADSSPQEESHHGRIPVPTRGVGVWVVPPGRIAKRCHGGIAHTPTPVAHSGAGTRPWAASPYNPSAHSR